MKNQFLIIVLLLSILAGSCRNVRNTPVSRVPQLYAQAIADAAYPTETKISTNLTIISKENKKLQWKTIEGEEHILVATWVSEQAVNYYPASGAYNTKSFPIWVTAIPDLKERYEALKISQSKDPVLRMKQLLGLPPAVNKTHFIEFWVKPQDIFRPCPDNEITDQSCGLCFPENTSEAHQKWINQLRLDSYYNCKGDKYPWTQLGYTYDWHEGNKSHIGLSEFVIKQQSNIYVNRVVKTAEYF